MTHWIIYSKIVLKKCCWVKKKKKGFMRKFLMRTQPTIDGSAKGPDASFVSFQVFDG